MIDLHFWPTPNGKKITVFLEETALPYRVLPVDIGRGEQFRPEFLAISPNNRMPAIVDDDPPGGGEPLSVFLKAWHERMSARPAVARGMAVGNDLRQGGIDEKARAVLFGQRATR